MVEEAIKVMEQGAKMIALQDKNIEDTGARRIARALTMNTQVSKVVLSGNAIGDMGASDLAETLKANTCLQFLTLNANNIGDAGARQLAEGLKTNTTLVVLDLCRNSIGNAGASELAEALTTNTNLKELGLLWNFIGEPGIRELAEALNFNRDLTSLTLEGNFGYRTDLGHRIRRSLRRNLEDPDKAEQEVESRKAKVLLTVHMEDGQAVCCYKLSGREVARLDGTSADDMTVEDWATTVAESMKHSVYRLHMEKRSDSTVLDINSRLSVRHAVEGVPQDHDRAVGSGTTDDLQQLATDRST